jgi:Uncharacterized conserved protein (DUF2304).
MDIKFRILSGLIGLGLISFIIKLVVDKKLSERNSIPWIFSILFILPLSLDFEILDQVAKFIGIHYAPSLLFFLGIIGIVCILMYLSIQISSLNENNKELAQRIALLQLELKKLKESELR